MSSVLDFERYRPELGRQLLRRIGYTNGLHKIRRFPRVVEYLYTLMPTSTVAFAQIIIDRENESAPEGSRSLKGSKYAQGIIDIAIQLSLIEKFSTKIALSSQGYACHALSALDAAESIDAFMLHKVMEADGEYTLNLLRLVDQGIITAANLGAALFDSFAKLIDFKIRWANEGSLSRFARTSLLALLNEAKATIAKASTGDPQDVVFFFKHTINPRIEWLRDLGCLETAESGSLRLSERGSRVLQFLKEEGYEREGFIYLPLDTWLSSQLALPSFGGRIVDEDFYWRLVGCAYSQGITESSFSQLLDSPPKLLDELRQVYRFVKLAGFNEADALSIYEVFASHEALHGNTISWSHFERSLMRAVNEFPGEIFKLTKRRGRGLYVALKGFS